MRSVEARILYLASNKSIIVPKITTLQPGDYVKFAPKARGAALLGYVMSVLRESESGWYYKKLWFHVQETDRIRPVQNLFLETSGINPVYPVDRINTMLMLTPLRAVRQDDRSGKRGQMSFLLTKHK